MRSTRTAHAKLGRLFVFVLIMTTAGLMLEESCDAVLNPWAHSVIYSRTLTGSWLGHVATHPPRIVFLVIHRPRSSGGFYARCRWCPDVEGWFRFSMQPGQAILPAFPAMWDSGEAPA